jgi:hypothetical protein
MFARFPVEGLPFEHTLFANLDEIWAKADERNVNTGMVVRGLAFNEVPPTGGQTANQIYIDWWARPTRPGSTTRPTVTTTAGIRACRISTR